MDFKNIEITGINSTKTKPSSPNSKLFDVVLDLSATVPGEWAEIFDSNWVSHVYNIKRRVTVSHNTLTIQCGLDELESEHLPNLRSVIMSTNKKYNELMNLRIKQEDIANEKHKKNDKAISDLKKKIKFD